jgi:hypothetical protein
VLFLGPGKATEKLAVVSSDAAKFNLTFRLYWKLDANINSPQQVSKVFADPDFVGVACQTVAGRIRQAASALTADELTDQHAALVKDAIWGQYEDGVPTNSIPFKFGRLEIAGVDVIALDRVDPHPSIAKPTLGVPGDQPSSTMDYISNIRKIALDESKEFNNIVARISSDQMKAIACASPQTQAELLRGFGLKRILITEAHNPIPIFNAARKEQDAEENRQK